MPALTLPHCYLPQEYHLIEWVVSAISDNPVTKFLFVMLDTLDGEFDDELLANTEKTLVKAIANVTVIFFSWFIFKILPHCETTEKYVSFPISFNRLYVVTEAHQVSALSDFKMVSVYQTKNTGFTINVSDNGYVMLYIAIGS